MTRDKRGALVPCLLWWGIFIKRAVPPSNKKEKALKLSFQSLVRETGLEPA